ncbi:hypothetical protein [Methanococcus sp. CF]
MAKSKIQSVGASLGITLSRVEIESLGMEYSLENPQYVEKRIKVIDGEMCLVLTPLTKE